MPLNLAIDFGTTNTVIASLAAGAPAGSVECVTLPGLSRPLAGDDRPPLIPSLLYVEDGRSGTAALGQQVLERGLTQRSDGRLFRSFKRGILAAPSPEPRLLDGVPWTDSDAGRRFLSGLLDALPFAPDEVEQLVVTAPVAAFDGYLVWLSAGVSRFPAANLRLVDESTAAALGYAVTEPGAIVLVYDFGGGSLDLSLVQLPESPAATGGWLSQLRQKGGRPRTARVIAKGGVNLGGSDVDGWLLAEALRRLDTDLNTLGGDPALGGNLALGGNPAHLLAACEAAKIALSSAEACPLDLAGRTLTLQRAELEALLEQNGYFAAIRRLLDRVMHTAQRQGIFREDIRHVLMVGGASLMPSVQRCLAEYFSRQSVRVDKPFTAIAEGALQLAAGCGLDDTLAHSYGLRYVDTAAGYAVGYAVGYDEIIPGGARYPLAKPVEVRLSAACAGQEWIELVVGEMDAQAVSQVQVRFRNGRAEFIGQAAGGEGADSGVTPLNAGDPLRLRLDPPGQPGVDRLRLRFTIDAARRLLVDAYDLHTRKELLRQAPLVHLHENSRPVAITTPPIGADPAAPPPVGADLRVGPPTGPGHTVAHPGATLQNATAVGPAAPPPVGTDLRVGPAVGHTGPTLQAAPALSDKHTRGERRLSLRSLGTLLNVLPPDAISLDAAAAALHSDEFYVRFAAAELLSKRGDRDARRILQATLTQGDAPQRASVAHHLHRFSWLAAEPLLRQALADPDVRVRESAIYSLCQLRGPEADALLLEALSGPEDEPTLDRLRLAAVWGLGRSPDAACVPALAAALQSGDPEIKVKALEALGAAQAASALDPVCAALDDPDPDVKYAAALSWVELDGAAGLPGLAALIRERTGIERAVYARALFHASNYLFIDLAGSPAAAAVLFALEAALQDPLPEARQAAAMPLAWMRHPAASALLLDAYRREAVPEVQARLLFSAIHLMSPVGKVMLAEGLAAAEPPVRQAAEYLARTYRLED